MHSYQVDSNGFLIAEHIGDPVDGWYQSVDPIDATKYYIVGESLVERVFPQPDLDNWKLIKTAEMKVARDTQEASGFPYMGKTLDSDAKSVERITVAVQAAQAAIASNQPFSLVWTCQDDSDLTLDAAGMMGVPVELALFANDLHVKYRTLKGEIDACTTVEDIQKITW